MIQQFSVFGANQDKDWKKQTVDQDKEQDDDDSITSVGKYECVRVATQGESEKKQQQQQQDCVVSTAYQTRASEC